MKIKDINNNDDFFKDKVVCCLGYQIKSNENWDQSMGM